MTAVAPPTGRTRRRLVVRGVVQGVGFRPHVARLAEELSLAGSCRNDATCVVIEVEGGPTRELGQGDVASFAAGSRAVWRISDTPFKELFVLS